MVADALWLLQWPRRFGGHSGDVPDSAAANQAAPLAWAPPVTGGPRASPARPLDDATQRAHICRSGTLKSPPNHYLAAIGGTVGPLIQYLCTTVVTTDEAVPAAAGGSGQRQRPEAMSPGRLAFEWFPEDQAECEQRDFAVLATRQWLPSSSRWRLLKHVGEALPRIRAEGQGSAVAVGGVSH